MSCSRPFADRVRALTLVEVMVSQTIAIVVISAMMAVVVAMVNKLQSEVAISDAQVNLRQVSHLLIRDTQGIGSTSASGTAGDFILISDGGTAAADTFTIFRRDESICGGSLPVIDHDGVKLDLEKIGAPTAQCPFVNTVTCNGDEVTGRALMVLGSTGKVSMMVGHTAIMGNGVNGACGINYPTGQQGADIVDVYNTTYGASEPNINKMFDDMKPIQILSGNGFTYRLDQPRNMLQRSTNNGVTFVDILEGVHDMQVQRVFQKGTDTHFLDEGAAFPAGVTKDDFIGLRIGLVTFGKAVDGLNVPPPTQFANRNLSTAPKNRRYRASFVLTAARNRTGA